MTTIDKAAIGFSIAIVAVGVAFAMYGDAVQSSTVQAPPLAPVERPAPIMQDTEEPTAPDAMHAETSDDKPEMAMEEEKGYETMKEDKEMKREDKDKAAKDAMVLVIEFEAGTSMIELFTSYDLSDEPTECQDENSLGISGHCVSYYIKGGTVTDVRVSAGGNSVIITIESDEDGMLKMTKSKESIDAISMILVDGEESNDHYSMTKEEMMKMKNEMKHEDGEDMHHGDKGMMHEDGEEMMHGDKGMMHEDGEEMMHGDDMTVSQMDGPKTVTVDMPEGTAVPGCEVDDACYIPADVTINVGDTVSWINSDVAAHTVTSGSPAEGPTTVFDSSLVMASATFEHTFDEAGTYEYFCMVHPWMVGTVTVN